MNFSTLKRLANEPYRLFFPLSLLVGVMGVMLWPLFYASQVPWIPNIFQLGFYPNTAHAHLMIEGFVGGFALGFVGTALPKMVMAPTLRTWQLGCLFILYLGFTTSHLFNYTQTGDLLFVAMMTMLLTCFGLRIKSGKSKPPPSLLLAAMGLISGTLGALWLATVGLNGDIYIYAFAQRLLYQAFILLPLLGIGCYIFPMILGTPNHQVALSGPKMKKSWRNKAIESMCLGLLIIISYWIEVKGQASAMSWLRVVLCTVWITKESGWLSRNTTKGVMSFGLRAGIVCLLGGMLVTAIVQKYKIALDHSLYIGGFGLITMMVATRVIYGHSGQGQKFKLWVKPITWTVGLVLFDMLTRVTADFMPKIMISHHVYAALLWVVVSILWGIAVIPSVRKQPPPPTLPKTPASPKPESVMSMNFRG